MRWKWFFRFLNDEMKMLLHALVDFLFALFSTNKIPFIFLYDVVEVKTGSGMHAMFEALENR